MIQHETKAERAITKKAWWKDQWNRNLKVPLAAVGLGLLAGGIFTLAIGKNPLLVYWAILQSIIGSRSGIFDIVGRATPLICTGLALSFAFRTGLFNIGAEGQFTIGMLASGMAALVLDFLPAPLLFLVSLGAGIAGGALWAGIPGWLKAKRGIHEVINSIMLNYIAMYLTNFIVLSPGIKAANAQATEMIPEKIWLPKFILQASANWGVLLTIGAVVLVYFLLWKTKLGYQIRATGFNADAAEYAGINTKQQIILAMMISGALAGLGGSLVTLGERHRVYQIAVFLNYGFDGIAVALIGRNHPIGVVLASLLFGVLYRSSAMIQITAGVPKQVVGIIQACIIFFVAADGIVKLVMKRLRRKEKVA